MPYFEPQWTTSWADAALLHAAEGRDLASGILGEMMPSLMPTMPYSSASATPDAADVAISRTEARQCFPSTPRGSRISA
jgi:hypothetical protein